MKLQPKPFNRIADGSKKIELRLLDEKRQQIEIGDLITFTKEPSREEEITTKVKGLLYYKSFEDILTDLPTELFGLKNKLKVMEILNKFYSIQDQERFGVIGIHIELV